MELHQVRYFLAVASTLNFTRAAEQCNVTQPALTKGVQKLEEELGGQLIYRERQLTQFTDLGKEVLPMLERTLASAETVRRRAREFQRKEVAPLKIGLAPCISASLVLDPIAETAKFVPGLHVELREGAAEKLVELLLEGKISAAMVGDVQDIPARIDDWSLFEERYVAVLAPTHQLANRPSIGIDDLRETVLLERAGCDVALKIQRSCFPEEPLQLGLQQSRPAPAAHGRGWLRRDTRAGAHAAPPDAQDHPARRRPGFAEGAASGCAGAPLLAGTGRFRQGRAASRLVGRSPSPGHAGRNAHGGGERAARRRHARRWPIASSQSICSQTPYRCQTRPTRH
jgi:DNA-binding transcriptional LysR family regulator